MDKVSGMRRTAKDMNPVDLGRGASYSNSYDQNDSDKPPSNSQIAFISAHALVGVLAIIALAIASAIATGSLPVGSLTADNIKEGDAPVQLATSSGGIDITAINNAASVDIASGSGGFTMRTDGSMILEGNATASSSSIKHAGGPGRDLNIDSTFGSLVLTGGEADVADAVDIRTTSTTGGINISSGSRGINLNSSGEFLINSTGAGESSISHTGAANNDLTIRCVNGKLDLNGGNGIKFSSGNDANGGIAAYDFNNASTTGNILRINAPSLTTGTALDISATYSDSTPNTAQASTSFNLFTTNNRTENHTAYGIFLGYDKEGITANGNTADIYGISVDLDDKATNDGIVNAYGLDISSNFDSADGTTTSIGINSVVSGADTNIGLQITSPDGTNDAGLKILSSGDAGDFFSIKTGANGETTFSTVDAGGTAAHLTFNVDGTVKYNSLIQVGANGTGHDVIFFGATTGAYMMWDESDDQLIIQTAAAGQPNPNLILRNSNNDEYGPILRFVKVDTTGEADDDSCGVISFYGVDNGNTATEFVKMEAKTTDITNNEEAGQLTFTLMTGGINGTSAATDMLRIGGEDSTSTHSVRGGLFTKAFDYTSAQLGTDSPCWGNGLPEVNISEHNGIVETLIFLDLGAAQARETGSDGRSIAGQGNGGAYFLQLNSSRNGYIFHASMTCLETPVPNNSEIDLVHSNIVYGQGVNIVIETQVVQNPAGVWEVGETGQQNIVNITDNNYLYLRCKSDHVLGTQTYTAGQYMIRLLGVAPCKSNGQPLPT